MLNPGSFWLILAPIAAVSALYLGYLLLLLVGLLSIAISLGLSVGAAWLATGIGVLQRGASAPLLPLQTLWPLV